MAAIISVAAAAAGEGREAAASQAVAASLAGAIASAEGGTVSLETSTVTAALQSAAGEGTDVSDLATALQAAVDAIGETDDVAGVEQIQTVVQGDLVEAVTGEGAIPDSEEIGSLIAAATPLRPTIDPVEVTDINAEAAAGFTLTGTGRDGTSINIQFGDVSITGATTVEDGTWSHTLTQVPSDGQAALTVTATETTGETSVTSMPAVGQTFTIDTTAPQAPVIAAVSVDDVIGFDEPTVTIIGAAEDGASVSVTFNGVTQEITAAGGAFSVDFAAPNENGPYTVTATATDAAGNTGAEGSRTVTVDLTPPEEPSDATALIGSALTLAEMESALTAFAAEQEGLSIPDGMLGALAGDALIYRGGQYSLTFSATVFANEDGDDIANGTTLSGTFQFELPLGDFTDQFIDAPNPEAVFKYEQVGVVANSFSGFDIDDLRLNGTSLRMDVEPFEVGPDDEDRDFIIALVGEDALNALNEAGTITSLQIWLSAGVVAQGQDDQTGEFFGLNGTEVSINLFRAGSVGLESFFDDMANINLRAPRILNKFMILRGHGRPEAGSRPSSDGLQVPAAAALRPSRFVWCALRGYPPVGPPDIQTGHGLMRRS